MGEIFLEPVETGTVRDRVTQRLSYHIVSGQFSPGQRLTERELAEALKVSRGSIREAVRDLVQVGLLESLPYRGLYVRSISKRNLEELYSLRTVIESFAFERLWAHRSAAALADLEARNAALIATVDSGEDGLLSIEQELHLHSWCYELSGHGLLQQSWQGMRPHIQFYFAMHQNAHGRAGPLRESHDLYVELAKGSSLAKMQKHLGDHMRQGLAKTLAALSETLPG
ncbi:MAG: GntR family transcriptional regulator [Sulfitobacter sp.]